MFSDNSAMQSNTFERRWINFNQVEFGMDYPDKDWSNIFNLKNSNTLIKKFC